MKTYRLFTALKKFLCGFFILFSFQLQAIENNEDSLRTLTKKSDWVKTSSIYIELGGKFLPSLNVDFRKSENFAISIGNGFWADNEENKQLIFTPSVNAYYLFGKRNRIEIGGGMGTFLSTYEGFSSLLLFGNVGYRYQKKKGLFFRIGFTPWGGIPINSKSRIWITPWAGISLGYSL